MVEFDNLKSNDEEKIERATRILSHTIPEQIEDAMEDYLTALSLVRDIKDWRIQPVVNLLERLYIYPQRYEHSKLIKEINNLKDDLLEERIQRALSGKKASKHAQKFLGDGRLSKYPLWWWVAVGVSLYVLFK